MYAEAILKKGEGRTLKSGGAWVYDNEIDRVEGDYENGDILAVKDFDGFFLGWGFINTRSKITIRVMSRRKEHEITEEFLEKRVRNAWEYRKATVDTGCCRLIFGEADWLPGLVVDKFSDVLVVESLALGIDRLKPTILSLVKKVLAEDGIMIRGIYERSDAKVRLQEGMERFKGFIGDPFPTKVEITENGVRYIVDVEDGQKTGFFLDQKYTDRQFTDSALTKGTGLLYPYRFFCTERGIAGARGAWRGCIHDRRKAGGRNAALNGLSDRKILPVQMSLLLPRAGEKGEQYDVVILDPPAFTKSRSSIKNAVKGYREINLRGMKLVKDNGFLVTCSCSHFMDPELFAKTIREAAHGAHKRLRQVEFKTQAPDHPILWAAEESYYLKFYIFQVCEEL